MKNNYYISRFFKIGFLLIFLLFSATSWCQVGIQSTSPKGALDIGSLNTGLVYPTVSLSDINTQTVSNPNAPNLIAGTIVYNTNTSGSGDGSVYPGLYFWDGAKWVPQFSKRDNKLYFQSTSLRTRSDAGSGGNQTVVFNSNSFTPKFNGKYRVLVTVHYGGGEVDSPITPQFANFVSEEGVFRFTFRGTTTPFTLKSFSGKNNDRLFKGGTGGAQKVYSNQYNQGSYIIEETLVANTAYTFGLTFNQETAPGFVNDGNGTSPSNGRGYINLNDNLKCTVELNYIGE
ncbi:hypothetical protein [Aequorivita lipolytica]|uniref:Uncharacterized protein n=1 Tax=Aequorivita lipolytica TaxID=153267 RepID=A0A5C6YRH4_9FLAO|nr:hypothetical protein [Aequorivita lipolytica]TXD69987.1 hypothetical protein ESV24_06020 [Aequorivita lipolytica]SRX50186.1 hypothetical protein AEQU2_00655 [Aequorivita lipolytica]